MDAAHAYDNYVRSKVVVADGQDSKSALELEMETNFGLDGMRHELVKSNPERRQELPWHRASRFRGIRASGVKWTTQISYEGTNRHMVSIIIIFYRNLFPLFNEYVIVF